MPEGLQADMVFFFLSAFRIPISHFIPLDCPPTSFDLPTFLFFPSILYSQVPSWGSLQDRISRIGSSAACRTPAATLP